MVGFTREEAGWEWMSFVVTRLLPGQSLELRTGDEEMVLVWLGGRSVATGEREHNPSGPERMYSMAFLIRSTCQLRAASR